MSIVSQTVDKLANTDENTSWCVEELSGVKLGDKRLDERLVDTASKENSPARILRINVPISFSLAIFTGWT